MKLIRLILLGFFATSPLIGQSNYPYSTLQMSGATGGPPSAGGGNFTQLLINGVAVGAGSVTGVSGTVNQIDSSGGTTPTLSLDSAIQLPGTLVGTSLNNWAYVDGFTSALYPGIGQAQVAFASTNEPLCQAVSYSAANYISVATGNGATTPGTNSAVWYPVQNANTPTQLDCAFYYTAAANQTAGRASALMFGNTISFSTDYATSIGLLEPILYRVSLIGVARGFNGGPTQIKSNYGGIMLDGQKVVSPTSLPYDFDIVNIDFNANNLATACIRAYGFKVSYWEHLSCHNWIATSTQAPITIGDGTSPYYNGGYQDYFDDIFVSGSGNNSSQWATVTVSTSGGVPSFTVTGGGTYTYSTSHVLFWGFSQGANPCTVMGTLTPTWSGSAGNYTLSSISASGFSGCAGPYYIQVPDISPAGYGIEVSLMTDSTFKDMVVKSAGWQRGIFYNANSSSVMIHDHVYGGSEWLISETSGNAHYGEEPDTPTYVAIETESAGASWTDTQLAQGGGGPPGTGTIGFFASNNNGNIIQSTCPNSSTSANVFSLVLLGSTGPVAHGGNYGNVNVVNGQQCDTLTSDNSFVGKLTLPSLVTSSIVAPGATSTDSAALGAELTSSGTCSGTGWTGTYPNYVAPGTAAALTCTGFTNGNYYQTVTGVTGNSGGGSLTIAIGAAQTTGGFVGTSSTTTAGLKASSTSLTYTPTSAFNGTVNISAKLISPISVFSYLGEDSTAAASVQLLLQQAATLHNVYIDGGGTYNTTGNSNSSTGYQSLFVNTTGGGNTANGYEALFSNTTGSINTANGYESLFSNTTGSDNEVNGVQALYSNTTGGNNTANGYEALYLNTTGGNNLADGYEALYSNTTGGNNIANGYQAGKYITGGSTANQTSASSTYLGYNTMAKASGDTDEVVIGYQTVGFGSHTATLGSPTTTATYLAGVTLPTVIYSHAGTQLAACASGLQGGEAVVSDATALVPGTAYSVSAGSGADTVRVQCTLVSGTYAWQTM